MQIGEFARICNTKISVLRHYDEKGLLKPDYVDRFTGYRYYKAEQIAVFQMISALKESGFSLSEIKNIIESQNTKEKLLSLFDKKEKELSLKKDALASARKLLLAGEMLSCNDISIENCRAYAPCLSPYEFENTCKALEDGILFSGYQRTSPFELTASDDGLLVSAYVTKLSDTVTPIKESPEGLSFENHPQVIGKWQVVGEFAVKEDFFTYARSNKKSSHSMKNLYFLPNGENYWAFSWTKGKLIIQNGFECSINSYTVEEIGDARYMFVSLKSYYYHRGGHPTTLVLRQLDNISYTKERIRKKDNVDLPFENDPRLIGRWIACDFVREKELFDPQKECTLPLFYTSAEFFENGYMKSTYSNGAVLKNTDLQCWTYGYILEKKDSCACAYEIKKIGKEEYLFIEWKSGDYVYGHMKPKYYVFRKEMQK